MNSISPEQTKNVKARSITLASALKIELTDDFLREATFCTKTAADGTLSPPLESSV